MAPNCSLDCYRLNLPDPRIPSVASLIILLVLYACEHTPSRIELMGPTFHGAVVLPDFFLNIIEEKFTEIKDFVHINGLCPWYWAPGKMHTCARGEGSTLPRDPAQRHPEGIWQKQSRHFGGKTAGFWLFQTAFKSTTR